jgi:hypothetical protein
MVGCVEPSGSALTVQYAASEVLAEGQLFTQRLSVFLVRRIESELCALFGLLLLLLVLVRRSLPTNNMSSCTMIQHSRQSSSGVI